MLLKLWRRKSASPWAATVRVERLSVVAGANRDLHAPKLATGRFREDLFAHQPVELCAAWPGAAARAHQADVDYLLMRVAAELGGAVRFTKEAKAAYLHDLPRAPEALGTATFATTAASVTRLATLAETRPHWQIAGAGRN